jgi:cyclopropane fatty-acyl-phospholipid synthase-like methyltransferase
VRAEDGIGRAKGQDPPPISRPVPSPTSWWERLYRSSDVRQLPWFSAELDEDFAEAIRYHALAQGRILDLGTGPATQAIALAKLGHTMVATDIAESAIRKARRRAKAEGVEIDFRVDNILDSRLEEGLVDTVIDRGVFHVLPPEGRPRYVNEVHRILRPRGLLLLKTFSDKEPGTYGPYRLSPGELRTCFRESFDIVSIEDSVFPGTLPDAPKALFAVLRRR